ncbi:hypothetical protein [Noviherbaspirillum humi]|nr:hypothetical protein [Noviherbaspirillum humi]
MKQGAGGADEALKRRAKEKKDHDRFFLQSSPVWLKLIVIEKDLVADHPA